MLELGLHMFSGISSFLNVSLVVINLSVMMLRLMLGNSNGKVKGDRWCGYRLILLMLIEEDCE